MKDAPGWYVDPNDSTQERYWNGSMWQDQTRRRTAETPYPPSQSTIYEDPDDVSHEDIMMSLARAQLEQQIRAANYLAILTYITVIMLVLGILAGVLGVIAAQS